MTPERFLNAFEENKMFEKSYYMTPSRWSHAIGSIPEVQDEAKWMPPVKYMNSTNDDISDDIRNLPNDVGGIYVFFIQGPSLPFLERYIAYIGRAQLTDSQTIRKRAKEYYPESQKVDGRIKIVKLFEHWKEYLYFQYFPCKDNTVIQRCEANLIHAIFPPFNDDIAEKIIFHTPINAF